MGARRKQSVDFPAELHAKVDEHRQEDRRSFSADVVFLTELGLAADSEGYRVSKSGKLTKARG